MKDVSNVSFCLFLSKLKERSHLNFAKHFPIELLFHVYSIVVLKVHYYFLCFQEFCLYVMKLVESPSVLIRAKALLVVLEIIKVSPEMIMACCQARYDDDD